MFPTWLGERAAPLADLGRDVHITNIVKEGCVLGRDVYIYNIVKELTNKIFE